MSLDSRPITAEPGGTQPNPAEPGGIRPNPAEPGGTHRNLAETGQTQRNLSWSTKVCLTLVAHPFLHLFFHSFLKSKSFTIQKS